MENHVKTESWSPVLGYSLNSSKALVKLDWPHVDPGP